MQLKVEALDAHCRAPLAPLYVITSDEELLALEAEDKIRQAARAQGFSERIVLTVDRQFKWGELAFVTHSSSLFDEKKIIELRMPGGKPGKEGAQALQDYVRQLHPDHVTLITVPKLDWATQKTAWVTALQKAAVYIDIPVMERAQLLNWIGVRLTAQGQSADKRSLEFMVSRVEGNLLAAHQEILKLGLLYSEGKLDFESIQDAVLNVARYDVFKLNEAMLSGDRVRLVRMVSGLQAEGEALPLVLWAVSEEIRLLLKLKLGLEQGTGLGTLLKTYRVWGPRERLMEPALRRLTRSILDAALCEAAQLDKLIKGLRVKNWTNDAWDALLQLTLKVAQ